MNDYDSMKRIVTRTYIYSPTECRIKVRSQERSEGWIDALLSKARVMIGLPMDDPIRPDRGSVIAHVPGHCCSHSPASSTFSSTHHVPRSFSPFSRFIVEGSSNGDIEDCLEARVCELSESCAGRACPEAATRKGVQDLSLVRGSSF